MLEVAEAVGTERRIVVDHERVDEVLCRLLCAFTDQEFPYSQEAARLPQDPEHMPKTLARGGSEHSMFMWTICYYMRGGIKSGDAVKRLGALYDGSPELFVAQEARTLEPATIAVVLKGAGLGFQDTVSKAWVENAGRLQDRYEGDPRNIYEGVNTYEECLERIRNDDKGGGFVGFQEKMTSMITYYLMDEGLIDYFPFPLPVDLHVLRVSIANELMRFEGYAEDDNVLSDELLEVMRQTYYDYAVRNGISMLRLCDAVWLLSQSICGKQPGNITLEPEGRANRNGRSTALVPQPIDPANKTQALSYSKSCGQCPVEETCKWNVPGKVYYVQGELKRRGERVKFPVTVQQTFSSP